MQPAMHIGGLRGVDLIEPVEHGLRLLRGRSVVEIDQRLAINLRRQDRKIRPDAVHVVGAVTHCRMHFLPQRPSILRGALARAPQDDGPTPKFPNRHPEAAAKRPSKDERPITHTRAFNHAATCSISVSRIPACSMPSIASPRNAWIRSASASAAGMPRAIR